MNKDNLIKLLVIVVVAAFALEGIAVYTMGGGGNQPDPNQPPVETTYEGTVRTYLTLDYYEPILTVSGNISPQAIELAKSLRSSGIATHYVKPDSKTIIINLQKSSDLQNSSLLFSQENLTSFSRAYFTMPPVVNLSVEGIGQIEATGVTFRDEIRPILSPGEEILAEFPARAVGIPGSTFAITAWGKAAFLSTPLQNISAQARVTSTLSRTFEFSVPWEGRNINASLLSSLGQVQYTPRSYAVFQEPITQDIIQSIYSKNLSYVSAVSSDTLSISPSFTDSSKIKEDLPEFSLSFPSSILSIKLNGSSNLSKEELDSQVSSLLGQNLTSREFSLLSLSLPSEISLEGKTYSLSQPTGVAYFEGKFENGQNISVLMDASSAGSTISSVDYIRKN